jgi:hypothetical protein
LNEKTTRQPDKDRLKNENDWYAYLKEGKKKKPALKTKKGSHFKSKTQARAMKGPKPRERFIGSLSNRQRKALLNGE